jgi:hypothetical protein
MANKYMKKCSMSSARGKAFETEETSAQRPERAACSRLGDGAR